MVSNLCNLIVEGKRLVLCAGEVLLELLVSLDLLHVPGDLFVIVDEFFTKVICEFTEFQKDEIDIREVFANKVLTLAQGHHERCHLLLDLLFELDSLSSDVAGARDGLLDIFHEVVELISSCLVFNGLREKLIAELGGYVKHNSVDIGETALLGDHVRHVREWQVQCVLLVGPLLDRVIGRVSLFVDVFFPGMFRVSQKVADWLCESTDLPVTNSDRLILRVLQLSGAFLAQSLVFLLEAEVIGALPRRV